MKFFVLILGCYVSSFLVESANTFKFEDCQGGRGIASVRRFVLSPDPISLSKDISASVQLELHEDLPPGTYIKQSIYKVTSLFDLSIQIPVPCIQNKGSCTTEACKYLEGFQGQMCPFFPQNVKCACPIRAGHYGGNNITIPVPKLGPFLKWVASGNFKIEMKLLKKEALLEKQVACFVFTGRTEP